MSAKIKIKTKQGKEFSEYTTIPKGEPIQKPLKKDEIIAKFRDNTDFSQIVSKDSSEKALQLLDMFEKLDNIDEVVKLLVMNK